MSIDTEYLAAVERGDMDTARRLMVEFAVSKGYVPVEVYHGTLRKFYVFDATKGKKGQPGNVIRDAVRTPQFFSFNEEFAKDYATFNMHWRDVKKVRLIKAFLRYDKLWDYRKPEDVDAAVAAGFPRGVLERGDWSSIESTPFQRWLQENGYDAFTNFERFAVNIAVFKPSQIKSAETVSMKGSKIVPLSKRFDVTKDDIRNPRMPESVTVIEDRPVEPSDIPRSAGFGVRRGTRKVTFNVWGALSGFEGRERIETFADEYDAADWLNGVGRVRQSGPIRLNPVGDDAEYLAAVERGDMKTAQRMVDEAAKKAGYKLRAGHATPYRFSVFDRSKISNSDPDTEIKGFFFSTEPSEFAAYTSGRIDRGPRGPVRIIDAYLRLGRMASRAQAESLVMRQMRDFWKNAGNQDSTPPDNLRFPIGYDSVEWIKPWVLTPEKQSEFDRTGKLVERGYELRAEKQYGGVDLYRSADIYGGPELITGYEDLADAYNSHSEGQYIVRDSSQIKSADPVTYDDSGNVIPLSKRFDVTKDDIRNPRTRSTPPQFPYEYAAYLKKHFPKIWAAGGNIRGNDTFRWWTAYRQGDRSPTVMHWWNVTRPAWIARHYQDHRLPGVIAQIKWGTVGTLGVAGMKRVVEDAIRHEIR